MFAFRETDLKARVTPYKNFDERMIITKQEIKDGGKVEFDESFVYSFLRDR